MVFIDFFKHCCWSLAQQFFIEAVDDEAESQWTNEMWKFQTNHSDKVSTRSITLALKCIIISLLYLMTTLLILPFFFAVLQFVQTQLWAHCAAFAFRLFFFSTFFYLFAFMSQQKALVLFASNIFAKHNMKLNLNKRATQWRRKWWSFVECILSGKWYVKAFSNRSSPHDGVDGFDTLSKVLLSFQLRKA